MKKRNVSALVFAGTLIAVPFGSQAQMGAGGGFFDRAEGYVGAGLGFYGIDENIEDGEFDDNNWAGRLFFGGRFNPYLGLEAGYVNFGEIEGELRDAADADAGGDPTFQGDGWDLAIVGYLPLDAMVTPYAKVGQLFWESEADIAGVDADNDGNDTFFGLGARFDFSESWAASVEYDRYTLEDTDANMISANALLKF